MLCQNCKSEIAETDAVCSKCGYSITTISIQNKEEPLNAGEKIVSALPLILAILSIFMLLIVGFVFSIPLALMAVILSFINMKRKEYKKLALAGLITSFVSIALSILELIAIVLLVIICIVIAVIITIVEGIAALVAVLITIVEGIAAIVVAIIGLVGAIATIFASVAEITAFLDSILSFVNSFTELSVVL